VFDAAAKRVEDAVLDVALKLEGVEVVGAFDDAVLQVAGRVGCKQTAVFALVVEA